jgi:hypothetical protein
MGYHVLHCSHNSKPVNGYEVCKNETTAAIIIGNGQSQDQLWAMHNFLADRRIHYEYW